MRILIVSVCNSAFAPTDNYDIEMTALLYLIRRTYNLYYCLSHVFLVLHDINYIILCFIIIITIDSQLGQLRSALDKLTYGAYICSDSFIKILVY